MSKAVKKQKQFTAAQKKRINALTLTEKQTQYLHDPIVMEQKSGNTSNQSKSERVTKSASASKTSASNSNHTTSKQDKQVQKIGYSFDDFRDVIHCGIDLSFAIALAGLTRTEKLVIELLLNDYGDSDIAEVLNKKTERIWEHKSKAFSKIRKTYNLLDNR